MSVVDKIVVNNAFCIVEKTETLTRFVHAHRHGAGFTNVGRVRHECWSRALVITSSLLFYFPIS